MAGSKQADAGEPIHFQKPDVPLRVGDVERESYHWKDIVNLTDPFVLNAAREKMLAAAMKR